MRRFFLIVGTLALAAIPIAFVLLRAPAIEVKPLPRKNPTSFVFHASGEATRMAMEAALTRPAWRGMHFTWTWTHNLVQMIGTRFHDPIGKSPVYFAQGEALDYLVDVDLRLVKRSEEETEVQVHAVRPEVINGKTFGFGSCGPGSGNRYVAVEPTTIEEYEILLRIGQALGEKDMPPLVLPQ